MPGKAATRGRKAEVAIRASVSFNEDEYAGLKEIAERNRVSIAWVVREAVATYLNDPKPLPSRKGPGGGA